MKVAMLTNKNPFSLIVLGRLKMHGYCIDCIFVCDDSFSQSLVWWLKKGKLRYLKRAARSILYMIFRNRPKHLTNNIYAQYAQRVEVVPDFKGAIIKEKLNLLDPDVLFLAGSGIIDETVFTIPRIGTLNAHPGLLPEYKGLNVVEWALYYEDPVGVTLHFVDDGIDTGQIVRRRELVNAYELSLDEVRTRLYTLSGDLFAEGLDEIKKTGTLKSKEQPTRGSYFSRMPLETQKLVRRRQAARVNML